MAKHAAAEPERTNPYDLAEDEPFEPPAEDALVEDGPAEDGPDGADSEELQLFAAPTPGAGGADAPGSPAGAPFPYPDQRRSRRTRKVLIALIIVVVLAIVAVAVVVVLVSMRQGGEANDQAVSTSAAADQIALSQQGANDAAASTREGVEVPALSGLVGLGLDEAVAGVGHGAAIVADEPAEGDDEAEGEEGDAAEADAEPEEGAVARIVTVELTEEPTDTRTGTPTVYLGLDSEGTVVEASFSSGLSQLGYAPMSFADAVSSARVVDGVLAGAGVTADPASIALPADPAEYTTYAADGTTIQRESYAFTGTCDAAGQPCTWTVELAYDYSAAASSGDVSSAVRRVTLTVAAA